jgi:hypothetical protein
MMYLKKLMSLILFVICGASVMHAQPNKLAEKQTAPDATEDNKVSLVRRGAVATALASFGGIIHWGRKGDKARSEYKGDYYGTEAEKQLQQSINGENDSEEKGKLEKQLGALRYINTCTKIARFSVVGMCASAALYIAPKLLTTPLSLLRS